MLIDAVKLAARIKGTALDSEITRLIAWAQAEMTRAGIPETVDNAQNTALKEECIINGCLMHISTDENLRSAAEKAFLYQLDCLRKSSWSTDPDPDPDTDPEGSDPNDP